MGTMQGPQWAREQEGERVADEVDAVITVEADSLEVEAGNFEQIPHWILFDDRVTANAVRLYLVLRSFAMGQGVAFPSRRRLAEALHVSMPTLDAAKRCLIDVGAIEVITRQHPNGDQTTNLYRLRWNLSKNLIGGKDSYTTPVQDSLPPPERNLPTETYPIEADPTKHTRMTKPVDTEAFIEFWNTYPRRSAKGKARTAWANAVRKADPQVIIAAAAAYRDDPNREEAYTAHPATWLNGERWLDEALPERQPSKMSAIASLIARATDRDSRMIG